MNLLGTRFGVGGTFLPSVTGDLVGTLTQGFN